MEKKRAAESSETWAALTGVPGPVVSEVTVDNRAFAQFDTKRFITPTSKNNILGKDVA
jgi:hypothetical protein